MKCLVILAACLWLGAGTQASTAHPGDCSALSRTNVRVRLTLTPEGVAINEGLVKGLVNRVWNAKGVKVEWAAAADAGKRAADDVDLSVNLRKSEINKAVDAAANRIAREYLIPPISAHHLLFAEQKGAVEEILGDTVSDEIRKFVSSAQCEQGR